jgi:hypothetical protein
MRPMEATSARYSSARRNGDRKAPLSLLHLADLPRAERLDDVEDVPRADAVRAMASRSTSIWRTAAR